MSGRNVVIDCFKIVLTLLIPPLGAYFYVGFSAQFWLNLLLTLLGYFPGLIHAIYIIGHPEMHQKD